MKSFKIILILIIFTIIITISVDSQVEFGGNCEDETIVYRFISNDLSDGINGHIAVWNDTSDGYIDVCYHNEEGRDCLDFDLDGDIDNVVFRYGINREKNAHVEVKDRNTSGYKDLCFGRVECDYKLECDGSSGELCFGSLNREYNSHVGDCDAYDTKICCSPGCMVREAFWSKDGINKISSANENDANNKYTTVCFAAFA